MSLFPLVIDLSNLTTSDGFIIQGDATGDQAGYSVASAGDVNGDGIDDLIVGARLGDNGGGDAGEAYVIYGAAGGLANIDLSTLTAAQGFIIQGDAAGDQAGTSVASAGDVNGDGIDDLIVGALFGDNGGSSAGEAYVIYGAAGGLANIDLTTLTTAQGFIIQGDEVIDNAGHSVSSAGDVNGDGIDDLIVGAPNGDNGGDRAGEAYVIYGKTGGLANIDLTTLTAAQGFIIQGDSAGDRAGWSVAGAGDVNGDGIGDVIVGALFGDNDGVAAGEAYVIYGAAGGLPDIDLSTLSASQGFKIQGDIPGDRAGHSVATAGDVNGDGINDLIIGAVNGDNGGSEAGEAYVIYGKAGGLSNIDLRTLTAAQGFIIQGDAASDQAGTSVAGAGDVNGDGIDDLIIGARLGDNGGSNAGEAYVIYGKSGGLANIDLTFLTAAQGFIIQGDAAGDFAGTSVAAAGDVNGDGIDDLIVGANGGDNGGTDAGEAYVIYGRRAPLFTTGSDTVDLNNFNLALYDVGEATDALAGDDHVTLSETQNVGGLFNGGAGADTIIGSANDDAVRGGEDADEIHLGAGNDVFRGLSAHFVPGEVIDGGEDTDTLRIEGGGTVDLTGVTIVNIENIQRTSGAGTTLIVADAATAALVTGSSTNDIVQIASGSVSEALVADLILNAGVERIEWSIPGFASAVEAVPDGLGGFIISYDDGDDLKPWDTIDAQYDSLGRKVAQTNDYDFPGPEGGITSNYTFDPATGFATTIVHTDGHLQRTFSTITTTLENGVVTKVDTVNDNDTLVEQFFTAGVITLERTTDTSSANAGKPWLYQDREYDGGVTQIFRTFWDAGVNGGGQHVVGTAGSQVIEGVALGGGVSTTNDALIGGAGSDTFRFVDGFGHDTIYDFADGADLLDLSSYAAGIETLAELQNAASITQVAFGAGFNTVIAFNGTSDQITIRNLTVAQLGDGDFAV